MILLDTCALSETRKPKPNLGVQRAIGLLGPGQLYVSAISIGEIKKGVEGAKTSAQKDSLQFWLSHVETAYAPYILPINVHIAKIWGTLTAQQKKQGRILHTEDGLIAATCLQRGLSLMTRNVKDFEGTGVSVVNPWE